MKARDPANAGETSKGAALVSGTAVYLLSNVLNAAIPFVLLPVLTRYLTPAEYGQVAMFQTFLGILGAFVGVGVVSGAARKFYDDDEGSSADLRDFIASGLAVVAGSAMIAGAVVLVFSETLSRTFSLDQQWLLWAVAASALTSVVQLRLSQWQVRRRPLAYGVLLVSQGATNMLLSILLVVFLSHGAAGRISAQLATIVIFAGISIALLYRDHLLPTKGISRHQTVAVLAFGVPLIPHEAGGFLLSAADRIVINGQLGLRDAGIYTVSVQLASGLGLVLTSVQNAYVPWLYERLKRNSEGEKTLIVHQTYKWFAALLLVSLSAFLIGPTAVPLIAGSRYSEAGAVIGWLLLGQAFQGMYMMLTAYVFYSKRTGLLSLVTIASGIGNVSLMLVLVAWTQRRCHRILRSDVGPLPSDVGRGLQEPPHAMVRRTSRRHPQVKITLVAQTPYQLLSCFVLARYSGAQCDLWLIDQVMNKYVQPCLASGLWNEVHFVEKSGIDPWKNDFRAKVLRFRNLKKGMRKIRNSFKVAPPGVVAIGSDNHELTAYFARMGAAVGAKVVMFEEGSTVHQSPYRGRAPLWKKVIRVALRVPNPSGFSIGWSPDVDTIVVSDATKTHPDYIGERRVVIWPTGPFPPEVMRSFLHTFSDGALEQSAPTVDLVYLGSPMQEEGWMLASEEHALIRSVTNTGTVWIKPHHFDSLNKYSVHPGCVLPQHLWNIPAEVLFHFLKPKAAVSVFSSAGINYASRYARTAIFIVPASIPQEIIPLIELHASKNPHVYVVRTADQLSSAIAEALSKEYTELTADEQNWKDTVHSIIYAQ